MTDGVKLHLGCGEKHIPGFLHIDINPAPHVDIVARVEDLGFLRTGIADLIYASHVLEHISRHKTVDVLKEWFRVLRAGGTLRVAVPDFGAVVEEYRQGQPLKNLLGLLMGGQRDEFDVHRMVFDEASLTEALREAGFTDMRRYDWRATEHAHIDDFSQAYLPHMEKETGRLMSLNMEARKPQY